MKTTPLTLLALALFQLTPLRAQGQSPAARPTPPPGPLMQKRAPEFASWVVSTRSPEAAGGAKDSKEDQKEDPKHWAAKLSITKTGKIYHVLLVDGQKTVWDLWSAGKMLASIPPKGSDVQFVATAAVEAVNPLAIDFSGGDFQGFEWISVQNYQGMKDVMGRHCLVFSDNVKDVQPVIASTSQSQPEVFDSKVACIDEETRLPVLLNSGNNISLYKFLTPPQAMQTIPAVISAKLNADRQIEQALSQKPSRPF